MSDDTFDLTLEDVTPREYLYLSAALEEKHAEIHQMEVSGMATGEDIDAIHSIIEKTDHEELAEETAELAESAVEGFLDSIGDADPDHFDKHFDGTEIDVE